MVINFSNQTSGYFTYFCKNVSSRASESGSALKRIRKKFFAPNPLIRNTELRIQRPINYGSAGLRDYGHVCGNWKNILSDRCRNVVDNKILKIIELFGKFLWIFDKTVEIRIPNTDQCRFRDPQHWVFPHLGKNLVNSGKIYRNHIPEYLVRHVSSSPKIRNLLEPQDCFLHADL
jgi:hypothetical protein